MYVTWDAQCQPKNRLGSNPRRRSTPNLNVRLSAGDGGVLCIRLVRGLCRYVLVVLGIRQHTLPVAHRLFPCRPTLHYRKGPSVSIQNHKRQFILYSKNHKRQFLHCKKWQFAMLCNLHCKKWRANKHSDTICPETCQLQK